jgi:UrcA family protein
MRRSTSSLSSAQYAAFAAAALVLAWGAGAGAQTVSDDHETVSAAVKVNDLDPSRERDAQVLLQRVRSAARLVCSSGELPIHRRAACAQASTEQAIRSLGIAPLTELYQRDTPTSQSEARRLLTAGR